MTKTRTFNDNPHSLKRRKRKLMGLYGAPRDVAPLFSISSLPSLESRIRSMIRCERVLLYIFSGAVRGGVHAASRVWVIPTVIDYRLIIGIDLAGSGPLNALDVAPGGIGIGGWDSYILCPPGFCDVEGLLRALSSSGG